MNKKQFNTGLFEHVRESDHILGASSNEIRKILFPNGDCSSAMPTYERQAGVYGDTSGCVPFSATNCVETCLKQEAENDYVVKGILESLDLYDENGDINCSDRFTAKESGTLYKDTDPYKGNYYSKVGDSLRNAGIIAEAKYPYPREQRTPVFTLDDYYQDLTQDLIDEAKKSTKYFKIKSTLIPVNMVNLREQLKYGPIQVGYSTTSPRVNGVYHKNTIYKAPNHAVMLYNQREDGVKEVLDNYPRVWANGEGNGKIEFASNFQFGHWGLQYYIEFINENNNMPTLKERQMYLLVEGNEQKLGLAIDGKLMIFNSYPECMVNSNWKKPEGISLADWDAIPHINSKREPIN